MAYPLFIPLCLGLGASLAQAESPWFYPGPGPERLTLDDDSRVGGLRFRRTGALLARVEHPAELAGLLDVADLEILAGDGHIVRILPRVGVDEFGLSRTLHDRPDVLWAHPDLSFELKPASLPNDPYVTSQWHLENDGKEGWTVDVDIDAETAWAVTSGAGALVAIVDSGVDATHPDLRVTVGWDYVDGDADSNPDPDDDAGPHGTGTAGLAAAAGDNGIGVAGVAWGADIYGIRLIGGYTSLRDLYDAFVEATDAGAWVISNSWGFGSDCSPFPTWAIMGEGIDYAETEGRGGLGTAVVAAAGNSNCDISNDGFLAHPLVIGVAATNGHDVRESYSCFGDHVDVAAPSGGILTTDIAGEGGYGDWAGDLDYYGWFSGTSASTPIVSGTLALMFAANPRLSAAEAREILCDTAVRVDVSDAGYDDEGWSPLYGCGRIDAGAAVLAVANEPPGSARILGPDGDPWEDSVLLRWAPALDPDGDRLVHEVSWWREDAPEEVFVETPEGALLDLTGVVSAGTRVVWSVVALDAWGPGETSEEGHFEVLALPSPEKPATARRVDASECAGVSGADPRLLVPALLLLVGRRRRG